MNTLIPLFISDRIQDGAYIQCERYCCKTPLRKECFDYYTRLVEGGTEGFHVCPHGMTSCLVRKDGQTFIFTSFRNRDCYNKKKARAIVNGPEVLYNPALDEKQIMNLINFSLSGSGSVADSILKKEEAIRDISHEVKKLNAQILEHCDLLLNETTFDPEIVNRELKTIYICSSMMRMRLSFYELESNYSRLNVGSTFSCVVYKKFDKIRRILQNYKKKNVTITISGNSYRKMDVYPIFDMIPLLLVENAVKYSFENSEVEILFDHFDSLGIIKIKSFSRHCTNDEIKHLFEKGVRGKNTKTEEGNGLGLFFVKRICDIHSLDISIESSSNKTSIGNIDYSNFIVTLKMV